MKASSALTRWRAAATSAAAAGSFVAELMSHGVLEPVCDAMSDLLRHQGGQLIRLARFECCFGCGDGRAEIRPGRLQASIGRSFASAVEPDCGLHEIAVGERLGFRPLPAHGKRLLEGSAQLRLGLGWREGQDEVDVPGVESLDSRRGHRAVHSVAMGLCAHRRKGEADEERRESENFPSQSLRGSGDWDKGTGARAWLPSLSFT